MPAMATNTGSNTEYYTTSDSDATSDAELHIRALAIPFKRTQLQQLEDGDLLVKDWPMLLEGQWTDSAVQTPLFYPAKTLESSAGNWVDNSGWTRHLGGVPRRAVEKVAEAINPHYGEFTDENGKVQKGVISDIRVYGFTQAGRDMQEMIKRKLIRYVSVEHTGDEAYNPQTRQMESQSVTFHGFAFVNKGACKACRINEAAPKAEIKVEVKEEKALEETPMTEEVKKDPVVETQKELAQAPQQIEVPVPAPEVKAAPIEVKAETFTIPKELSELPELIKALSARIDALEQDGKPKTSVVEVQPKELEEPDGYFVKVNRKTGIIGR